MRFCIEIAFDGTNYHGWQNQPDGMITVQQMIEEKVAILLQKKINIVGASRTDAGVHIKQTYAHFDSETNLPAYFLRRLNFMLPPDIAIKNVRQVGATFHTRFDAIQREYQYFICYQKDPFAFQKKYHYPYQKLDVALMNKACAFIKTQHDFDAFCKRHAENKTTFCRIDLMQWNLIDENNLVFTVKADRYLRGMVKGLVGTMILVGRGIYAIEKLEEIFATQNKQLVNFAVPGSALYLTEVCYDKAFYELPLL